MRIPFNAQGSTLVTVGDADRKMWIEPQRETNLGMAQALFKSLKILFENEQNGVFYFFVCNPKKYLVYKNICFFLIYTLNEMTSIPDLFTGRPSPPDLFFFFVNFLLRFVPIASFVSSYWSDNLTSVILNKTMGYCTDHIGQATGI